MKNDNATVRSGKIQGIQEQWYRDGSKGYMYCDGNNNFVEIKPSNFTENVNGVTMNKRIEGIKIANKEFMIMLNQLEFA